MKLERKYIVYRICVLVIFFKFILNGQKIENLEVYKVTF